MLVRIAARETAIVVHGILREHPGIDYSAFLKIALHELVEKCNGIVETADTHVGEVEVAPDDENRTPTGRMHARCIAWAVFGLCLEALVALEMDAALRCDVNQLMIYLSAKMAETGHTYCSHEQLLPISEGERLFTI